MDVCFPVDCSQILSSHLSDFTGAKVAQYLTVDADNDWIHDSSQADGCLCEKQVAHQNGNFVVPSAINCLFSSSQRGTVNDIVMDKTGSMYQFSQYSENDVQAAEFLVWTCCGSGSEQRYGWTQSFAASLEDLRE